MNLSRALRAGLGLSAIVVEVVLIGPGRIGHDLTGLSVDVVVLAVAFIVVDTVATTLRWLYLVRHDVPLSRPAHVKIYLYSNFLNAFGLGSLTGDGYRVVNLRRAAGGASRVVALIVRERTFGLGGYALGYLVAACAAVALGRGFRSDAFVWSTVAIVVFATAGLAIVVAAPRFLAAYETKRQRLDAIARAAKHGLDLGSAVDISICSALSMLAWSSWIAAVLCLAGPLRLGAPWAALASIATLTEFIRFVPITFQGIGVREVSFAGLVRLAGGTEPHGFALGVVAYLLLTLSFLASAPIAWLVGLWADRQAQGSRR
ncbi:MAG TPA: lysylphosphatidylglycerol synthase transmembrane domain-containing protein [Acidimicrobiales bacterium]|nr:lysylphosphatidylglycerol synthase transmembrane domain-containing protein [Acidimicrobiales bacterium]